jgi:TIR domain
VPRDQVFISYSHKDKRWHDNLVMHLKPFLRSGSIVSWSDQQIAQGSEWFKEIQSALANSKVAVLLVSPYFLASDFIHEHELGPLLKEAKQGGVKTLWVPVRDCAYKKTALKDYHAVLDPGTPLAKMMGADRDSAWVTICEKIEKAVSSSKEPFSEDSLKDAISQSAPSIVVPPGGQKQGSGFSTTILAGSAPAVIGIGSSVEPFYARGPGDNYDSALLFYIRNRGGKPLYIALAVYFLDRAAKIPIYANAWRSQKYPSGYEVKFGRQWKDLDVWIQPGGEVDTYIPLEGSPTSIAVPAGERGTLLLEYVLDGISGIHRGKV